MATMAMLASWRGVSDAKSFLAWSIFLAYARTSGFDASDLHPHDLLVGRNGLVPHLQHQIELQVRALGRQRYRMQFLVAAAQEILDRLIGLRLGLLDGCDHSLQHGLKRARATGAGRIHLRGLRQADHLNWSDRRGHV